MNIINKYVWLVETIYRAHKISFEDINRKWLDDEDFSEGVELPLRTFHKWRIAVEEMFGLVIENEKRGELVNFTPFQRLKKTTLSKSMLTFFLY